jgi:outer membrane protein assembly factor BamB
VGPPRLTSASLLAAALSCAGPAPAADWPTVHHDARRSGFTADCVRGPYRLEWVTAFPREAVSTRVEAVVADGKVFVSTTRGTLWALDRSTGKTVWKHAADGPVQHSPAFAAGRLFFGDAGGAL